MPGQTRHRRHHRSTETSTQQCQSTVQKGLGQKGWLFVCLLSTYLPPTGWVNFHFDFKHCSFETCKDTLFQFWPIFVDSQALSQYDSAARDLLELQKIEPKNAAAKKEIDIVLEFCRQVSRVRISTNIRKSVNTNANWNGSYCIGLQPPGFFLL